jgi:hypothetical protein
MNPHGSLKHLVDADQQLLAVYRPENARRSIRSDQRQSSFVRNAVVLARGNRDGLDLRRREDARARQQLVHAREPVAAAHRHTRQEPERHADERCVQRRRDEKSPEHKTGDAARHCQDEDSTHRLHERGRQALCGRDPEPEQPLPGRLSPVPLGETEIENRDVQDKEQQLQGNRLNQQVESEETHHESIRHPENQRVDDVRGEPGGEQRRTSNA